MEEVLLTSGRPLVRWKARGGLAEVYRWLDEGRDPQAFIDMEVWLDDAMSLKEIQQLRKSHDGIIHIRPVYPEMAAAGLLEQRSELPVHELFRKFYQRQTGGALPEDSLVQLFPNSSMRTSQVCVRRSREIEADFIESCWPAKLSGDTGD